MFAYCLNDPINLSDEDGKRADSYGGWAGEEFGKLIYEWITGDDHPNDQAEAIENEIISTQTEMIADATEYMWDAYKHSIELQAQQQYQKDMLVIKTAEFTKEHPLLAVDIVAASVGAIGVYCCVLPLAGVAVPVALSGAITIAGHASTLWGVYRTFSGAWNEWQAFIEEG